MQGNPDDHNWVVYYDIKGMPEVARGELRAHEWRGFEYSKHAYDFLEKMVIPNAVRIPVCIEGPRREVWFDSGFRHLQAPKAKREALQACRQYREQTASSNVGLGSWYPSL